MYLAADKANYKQISKRFLNYTRYYKLCAFGGILQIFYSFFHSFTFLVFILLVACRNLEIVFVFVY